LRLHNWPGLALAGGVVIAAVIALLVISGSGGAGNGSLPPGIGPGDTRLLKPSGRVAVQTGPGTPGRGASHIEHGHAAAPGSDAATTQYGAGGTRGTVFGDP
jgi:hypothetical protein